MNSSIVAAAARSAVFRLPRNTLLRLINLFLFLGGCLLAGTAGLLEDRLPRGRSGQGLTVLSLDRHGWGEVHAWTGYVLVALVVAHLLMHRGWLTRVAASGHGWRLGAGLAAGVLIIAFFALVPVRP